MNMLISSNLRLHTQITINCASNFSRLFVLKMSTKLCIQCSVMYEYKRWTCSNISEWEYLYVQIWCNSIIWIWKQRDKNLSVSDRGMKCSRDMQLSLWPIEYVCISVIGHQSSARPLKSLRLDRALNNSRKPLEKYYCELA